MTNQEQRKKLVKYLNKILKRLKNLTVSTYYRALEYLRDTIEAGASFNWNENPTAQKKVDKLLDILEGKINVTIANGVSTWYQEGLDEAVNAVTKELRGKGINARTRDIKNLKAAATTARRTEAMAGHARTVSYRGGAINNLSNRVWSFKDNAKNEIEAIIQKTIQDGKGVHSAKSYVKEFLNTDGKGQMKVRGRGVYRTVLKNCERLMRTEINAAYRSAEVDSYQAMDVVLGYKINLSGNHTTTTANGAVVKISDICDECTGDYPKNFIWFGWHPNCRCYITPITMSPSQFGKYQEAEDEGRAAEYLDSIMIKTYPDGFINYFRTHGAQFRKKPPQWLKDNPSIEHL